MDSWALFYFIINLLIPLALAWGGYKLSAREGRAWMIVGGVALCLMFQEAWLMRFPEIEYRLFPWIDYPWFRGWGTWGGFLVFGIGLHRADPRNRRGLLIFIVFLLVLRMSMWWQQLLGLDFDFEETGFYNGICWQSTEYTCTPTSCATMLSFFGVQTSEKEMARLCLTGSMRGTDDIRAARGLRMKTDPSRYNVRIARTDAEGLQKIPRPCLTNILLAPMLYHTVVVLDADTTGVRLADPSQGVQRKKWSQFTPAWSGTVVYLEER